MFCKRSGESAGDAKTGRVKVEEMSLKTLRLAVCIFKKKVNIFEIKVEIIPAFP